jgi:hypothetical protein
MSSTTADDDRDRSRRPGRKVAGHLGIQPVRRTAKWGKQKHAGSSAEYPWNRLNAVDSINQGILLWIQGILLWIAAVAWAAAFSKLRRPS